MNKLISAIETISDLLGTVTRLTRYESDRGEIIAEPVGDRLVVRRGDLIITVGRSTPPQTEDQDYVEWGFSR